MSSSNQSEAGRPGVDADAKHVVRHMELLHQLSAAKEAAKWPFAFEIFVVLCALVFPAASEPWAVDPQDVLPVS